MILLLILSVPSPLRGCVRAAFPVYHRRFGRVAASKACSLQ